eukprot:5864661-Amphidinium_carterae.1
MAVLDSLLRLAVPGPAHCRTLSADASLAKVLGLKLNAIVLELPLYCRAPASQRLPLPSCAESLAPGLEPGRLALTTELLEQGA